MRALILIPALLAAPLLAPPAAAAQTSAPSTLCTIRSTGLNFGPYSALDQTPNTASAMIEVICPTPGQAAAVRAALSPGRSGRHLDRTMTGGDGALHYNIHTDPGHHRVAGDGTNGTVAPVRLVRGLGHATFRLYGQILPRQSVRAGDYDDSLRVTIEF